MRRDLFTEDHEAFRELARNFVEKEVVPAYPEWEKGGRMPRDVFKKVARIYAGSSEVMKVIIAKSLGL
jgi:acyl-CoA dehydrogenase